MVAAGKRRGFRIQPRPVSRASNSPYAIAGREKHASMWDTTFWRDFAADTPDTVRWLMNAHFHLCIVCCVCAHAGTGIAV
eukprot:scaffold12208_cov133-Isochrysis_galbana.AAC.3